LHIDDVADRTHGAKVAALRGNTKNNAKSKGQPQHLLRDGCDIGYWHVNVS
jgi:hypothetical protein